MVEYIKFCLLLGLIIFLMFLCARSKSKFWKKEIPNKIYLAVRIIGCCVLMLSIWGLSTGSVSAVAFVLIALLGIVVGYKLHVWTEHVQEKCKNRPPTEKERQRYTKYLSMGKWKFVFFHGVLLGGIMGALFLISFAICSGFDLWAFVIMFVFCMIMGMLECFMFWDCIQDPHQKNYMQ